MDDPINMSINIIQLINTLIQNKGINIKKLYRANKEILESNEISINHIYCKNRTNKHNLCLNKCIDESKYCKIHDPIMRENRIINRRNMNIRRRLLKKETKGFVAIDYEIGEPYEPSAPFLEDIKDDPPTYTQKPDETGNIIKPDETGNIIKNFINNKNTYNIILDNNIINSISDSISKINTSTIQYYKNMFIQDGDMLAADNINITNVIEARNTTLLEIKDIKDNYGNILPLFNNILLNYNNKVITDIEEYKDKLNNLDYQEITNHYKGLNIQKVYRSTIELQFKLLLSNGTNTNINSKLLKFINTIIKRIPK